jgi:DNA-binding transcriptional ArsR family regulator
LDEPGTKEKKCADLWAIFQLLGLREAGLVEGVRVGRWTYYRLRPGALEALAQELLSLAC